MKALVLDQPGRPETLHLDEMPMPKPAPGEVRVRVRAVGLNPVDYKLAASGFRGWRYPFILGLDVAGTIDALGTGVANWQVGDAVYYHGNLAKPGGYAEYAIAPALALAHLPAGVSFPEAAALPCAGLTAYQALHRKLHIQPQQTILIHAGAGGVGGFAIQLAAIAGLTVFATCSARNADYVRQLGAADVLDYHIDDIPAKILERTDGRGLDAILDTISSESATIGLSLLAFNGGIACVAGLPDFTCIQPFAKALSVHEIALGGAYLSQDPRAIADLAQMGQELGDLVSTSKINPMLTEVIRFEAIPDALMRLAERHVRGKIVAQLPAPQ